MVSLSEEEEPAIDGVAEEIPELWPPSLTDNDDGEPTNGPVKTFSNHHKNKRFRKFVAQQHLG
ncbi:hypothetical protein OUZ56_005678 [Daphnia magna]|uniref:Uncharacterized protein n=1 Tax=Daphnia magna TaxID=35525 RepID=A0ABQ9YTF6_9CRUS|nr:hypothetical protein OUZ56_005678 [Daphnia magna]